LVGPIVLLASLSSSFRCCGRTCGRVALTRAPARRLWTTMRKSRVKEWFSDGSWGLSVAAGFPLAVPHQPNPGHVALPFPSPPPVRSVFPHTAVRQSSPAIMHRFRHILQLAAADIGQAHRIQLAVRVALPPEPPAFTSLGQGATTTNVDKARQPAEGLAGIGVPEGVHPPRHQRIDLRHEFLGTDRCPSGGQVFELVAHRLLGGLGREEVEGWPSPRGGLWRLTNWRPRKSKPSVKRVSRVLSRLSVRSIRVAIASKAARAGRARLRQTSRASSA